MPFSGGADISEDEWPSAQAHLAVTDNGKGEMYNMSATRPACMSYMTSAACTPGWADVKHKAEKVEQYRNHRDHGVPFSGGCNGNLRTTWEVSISSP